MWRASAHLGLVIAADSLFTPDNAYPDFTSLESYRQFWCTKSDQAAALLIS